ncbi:MAG TPA: MarR family transcriptional regulator [Iamia sp.]|nr:MarR family transcriptional regulator [Iamia sp.]
MKQEDALAFADSVGRFFARQYGMPPMAGRVLGWLLICDPPERTAAELSEELKASRTAIGTAVDALERSGGLVQRRRAAGERADRISVGLDVWDRSLDTPEEYAGMAELCRTGLRLLGDDAPLERRRRLLETEAFSEFLVERTVAMAAEWREHRARLVADGRLPE